MKLLSLADESDGEGLGWMKLVYDWICEKVSRDLFHGVEECPSQAPN